MKDMKHAVLEADNASSAIVEDIVRAYRDAGYSEDTISVIVDNTVQLLNDATGFFGEGTEVEYRLTSNLFRTDLKLSIEGEHFDPFEDGDHAETRQINNVVTLNLNSGNSRIHYKYANGKNRISVSKPHAGRDASWLKNPYVIAVVLGIVAGLICQHLPEAARRFIIDQLATPIQSVILGLLAGMMGPVIFISMITSIAALDSINDLTNLGTKIVKRFVMIILFVMAVAIVISGLFFNNFGKGGVAFASDRLIGMVLDVIPTNVIDPFLNNNTAQIVILGFLLGVALLLLGEGSQGLSNHLMNVNEWTMSVLSIVLAIMPVTPFLSLLITIGDGNGKELLEGWKFIAASYVIFTVIIVVKAVKTSMVTGVSIPEYWKKIKPVVAIAFTTGSQSTPLKQVYEVSDKELNIKPEFTSFWVPLCSAMLSLSTTVNVVIGTFMLAQIAGVPISASMLIALVIVTFELSIASPEIESAWATVFHAFALPAGYVGIFSAYKLLTKNYYDAVLEAYCMLEETEAAYRLGGIRS